MLGRLGRKGAGRRRCAICGATLTGPAVESMGTYFCLRHPSGSGDPTARSDADDRSPASSGAASLALLAARVEVLQYALVESAWSTDRGFHRQEEDDHAVAWEPVTPEERSSTGEAFTPADAANLARGNVYVVTDGGGGRPNGVLASRQAAEALMESYVSRDEPDPAVALASALVEANRSLYEGGTDGPGTMATSCVCAVVRGATIYVAHLGHSRAYLLRRGRLTRLTDAQVSGAQVKAGPRLREERWASKGPGTFGGGELGRLFGAQAELAARDFVRGPIPAEAGDRLLLCTDGLWGPLGERTLETLLGLAGDVHECAGRLSQAALLNNGPDNATALVAEVDGFGVHDRLLPPPVFPDWLEDWGTESGEATGRESAQRTEARASATSNAVEESGVAAGPEVGLDVAPQSAAVLAEAPDSGGDAGRDDDAQAGRGPKIGEEGGGPPQLEAAVATVADSVAEASRDDEAEAGSGPETGEGGGPPQLEAAVATVADSVVEASRDDEAEAGRGPEPGAEGEATGAGAVHKVTPTGGATLVRTRRRHGWRWGIGGVLLVVLLVAGGFCVGRVTIGALISPSLAGGGSTLAPSARAPQQSSAAGRSGGSPSQGTSTPVSTVSPEPGVALAPSASVEPTLTPEVISSPERPAALPPSASPEPTATAVRSPTPLPVLSPAAGATVTSTPSRTEAQASCFLRVDQPGTGPYPPGIRLRPGPSQQSGDLGAITDGALLEWAHQRSPGSDPEGPIEWYEVRLGTRSGWVSSRYLRTVGC